jgi:hypothetical protein
LKEDSGGGVGEICKFEIMYKYDFAENQPLQGFQKGNFDQAF